MKGLSRLKYNCTEPPLGKCWLLKVVYPGKYCVWYKMSSRDIWKDYQNVLHNWVWYFLKRLISKPI